MRHKRSAGVYHWNRRVIKSRLIIYWVFSPSQKDEVKCVPPTRKQRTKQISTLSSTGTPIAVAYQNSEPSAMNPSYESPTRKRRNFHSAGVNSSPSIQNDCATQKLPFLTSESYPRTPISPRKASTNGVAVKGTLVAFAVKSKRAVLSSTIPTATMPHQHFAKSNIFRYSSLLLCGTVCFLLLIAWNLLLHHQGLPELRGLRSSMNGQASLLPGNVTMPYTSSALDIETTPVESTKPETVGPSKQQILLPLLSLNDSGTTVNILETIAEKNGNRNETAALFVPFVLDAVIDSKNVAPPSLMHPTENSSLDGERLLDVQNTGENSEPAPSELVLSAFSSSGESSHTIFDNDASVAHSTDTVAQYTAKDSYPMDTQPETLIQVTANRFAYAYVVGGCDPEQPVYRNFLYNILVNTRVIRQEGSEGDVIVFVQMLFSSKWTSLPEEDLSLLTAMNIKIQYIPPAMDEGFDNLMMEKFRALGLTDYERVVVMDADIMLRGSLDYLLNLSVRGIFKRNIVFAGRYVPATGGLFVLSPGNMDKLLNVVRRTKQDGSSWNATKGWGHSFDDEDYYELINGKRGTSWDFRGASSDQGLLYHWTKYEEKSLSIVVRDKVMNFESVNGEKMALVGTISLDALVGMSNAHSCWETFMAHKPCKAPHSDFLNFPGSSKPWFHLPPVNYNDMPAESPIHLWYHSLSELNDQLKIGLDFQHWRHQQRPPFGYQAEEETTVASGIVPIPQGKVIYAPISRTKALTTRKSDFLYYYVIGGCDPNIPAYKNFIHNVLVNTKLQREDGSNADVLVYFQMSHDSGYDKLPDSDVRVLSAMNILIEYIPMTKDESFERLMFDKFRILNKTKYKRVMYLDSDIMVRGSFDYLFHMSMKGIIKENVVFAGRLEPAIGGLFMLSPKQGDWDRLLEVVREKEVRGSSLQPPFFFDEEMGWGHPFGNQQTYELVGGKSRRRWDFDGASSDQGLLYSWVRFEKTGSVSIVQKDKVQHFVGGLLKETKSLSIFADHAKIRDCWAITLNHKPCLPPHSDYVHFPGHKKPWMKNGPPADLFNVTEMTSPTHFWFATLASLNEKLELGLNFTNWVNNLRPLLGARPNYNDRAGITYVESASKKISPPYTTYRRNETSLSRFAYAYVVGGCKPEDPAYRNYLNDVFVSTYRQREDGSQADVIIFVQMAFESTFDALPETDSALLRAANIIVQYIPKAEDESFYRIMMDKFRVLTLTHYERVLFMDADVMAMGSLDYIFDLSVQGVIKKNLVVAGPIEPASGGFFMLSPSDGASDRLLEIIRATKERGVQLPYPHWDNAKGWGHVIDKDDYYELLGGSKKSTWDFYGAFADQGTRLFWLESAVVNNFPFLLVCSHLGRHSIQKAYCTITQNMSKSP